MTGHHYVDGLTASLHALTWAAGAATPIAALAAAAWLTLLAAAWHAARANRRATSRQAHAAAARSGRTRSAGPVHILDGSEHIHTGA